jgi:hypothetical protein
MDQALKNSLSKDGRDWLTTAIDPFHDYEVALRGIPDHDTEPTAIQVIHKKVTIEKPSSLGAGEKWDCHICTMPYMNTWIAEYSSPSPVTNKMQQGSPGVNGTVGTVTVSKQKSGVMTFPNTDDDLTLDPNFIENIVGYSPSDTTNAASMKKIIAGGFEVHNDTADLYKNGNVAVYEAAQSHTDSLIIYRQSATFSYPSFYSIARMPPGNVSRVSQHPATRNWEAAKGCYVPFRLDLATGTEFKPADYKLRALADSDTANFDQMANRMLYEDGTPVQFSKDTVDMDISFPNQGNRDAAISTTGAYFSGLSEETVLTLDMRFVVEVAPTAANLSMLSMTSPTAMYDPKALQLYCNTIASLPVGVPVSMNAKGDFWRMALKAATTVARIAAPVVTLSGRPALGAAITTGGDILQSLEKPGSKKKTPADKNKLTKANNTFRSRKGA